MKRFFPRVALIGALMLAVTLGACDITELNDNPNQPGEATLPYLLTNVQTDFADIKYDGFYSGRFGMLYAQYWSETQYTNESRYLYPIARAGAVDDEWYELYDVLNDLQEIIRINRKTPETASVYGPNDNQIAIAEIMQVYVWQYLTDIWGPAPFKEALQGRVGNTAPAYASQQTIYTSILDSLNRAIGLIQVGSPALASGDLIFGGDMAKWKAFANSLKMRIAIRMADVAEGSAQKAFAAAKSATTIDEAGINVFIPFSADNPTYWNPIYANATSRDDWGVSTTLLGLMNTLEDPRRAAYAQKSDVTGTYVGFPYGLNKGPANAIWASNNFSRPGERVAYRPDAPAILMLPDEVLFAKAEAAARGWGGNAAALYEQAVTASLTYWGVSEEAAAAYVASVPYDNSNNWAPAGNPTWKQTLGIQKWIAFYMQGIQGWSVFRRLDFEGLLVAPPGDPGQTIFGKTFPVRLSYPNSEYSLNPSIQGALEMLGAADATAEDQGIALWWDVNPQPNPAK